MDHRLALALAKQPDFPVPKGPLGPSTIRPRIAPKSPNNFYTLAADNPKPKPDHILGYMAQNAISSTPYPPANHPIWWFSPLKIALTEA